VVNGKTFPLCIVQPIKSCDKGFHCHLLKRRNKMLEIISHTLPFIILTVWVVIDYINKNKGE